MSTLLSVLLTKAGTTEEKAHACAPQQQRTEDLVLLLPLAPFIEGSCLTGLWTFAEKRSN